MTMLKIILELFFISSCHYLVIILKRKLFVRKKIYMEISFIYIYTIIYNYIYLYTKNFLPGRYCCL